jgi:hypothetical protein
MPTRDEIDKLKEVWARDPCWDIEDTSGYDKHRDELVLFRKTSQDGWEKQAREKFLADAKRIGCENNPVLAEYVFQLERRLADAVDVIQRLQERLPADPGFTPRS